MIKLDRNVDYSRFKNAFEALANGKSVEEAVEKIIPPKAKEEEFEDEEETEEVEIVVTVDELFKKILKNLPDKNKTQPLIKQLNEKIKKDVPNVNLLELLGVYENGKFVYSTEEFEFNLNEYNYKFTLKKHYEMAYAVFKNENLERVRYMILLKELSKVPAEEENATKEQLDAVIDEIKEVYNQMEFDESSFVPGALSSFGIVSADDQFLKPKKDEEVATFINRYVQTSRYLLLRFLNKEDEAERILENYRRPNYKGDINCLKFFNNLEWIDTTVNNLEVAVEIWNKTCIDAIRKYVNSLEDSPKKQAVIGKYVALGMGKPGGSIKEWKVFSNTPNPLDQELYFAVPIPSNVGSTQSLNSFKNYREWVETARSMMTVESFEEAKLIGMRINDLAETIWGNVEYDENRSELYYSSNLFRMWLTDQIKTKYGTYNGVLPTFLSLVQQQLPIDFQTVGTDLIVALNVLYNIIENQTISVQSNTVEKNTFQFSKLQLQSIFTFGIEAGYINIVKNKPVYIRQWVSDSDNMSKSALFVENRQAQMIYASRMIAFVKFLLDITNKDLFYSRKTDKVVQIIAEVYEVRATEMQSQENFVNLLFKNEEMPEFPALEKNTEFDFSLECVNDFRQLVDKLPSSVTLFKVGTDKAWPRQGLLKALNNRVSGCVGLVMEFIEGHFDLLEANQKDALIKLAKIVGAYKNGRFIDAWAGTNSVEITTPNNLDILAKSARQFNVLPIRQLAEAWAYFVRGIRLIGQDKSIQPVLDSLKKIGFSMEKKLFDKNGTFIGTQDITQGAETQEFLQKSRPVESLISQHQGQTGVFGLLRKIRESPEYLKEFKKHVSQDDMIKLGLMKNYHGKLIYTTGIASIAADPEFTSEFVPVFVMPDGTKIPYSQHVLNELQDNYNTLIKIMMQILSNKPVTYVFREQQTLPEEIKK